MAIGFTPQRRASVGVVAAKTFMAVAALAMLLLACPPPPPPPPGSSSSSTSSSGSTARECVATSLVWPTRTIPVCWENIGDISEADRNLVRAATAGSWERESRVRFTEWDACTERAPGMHIVGADTHPRSHIGTLLDGVTARVEPLADGGDSLLGGMVLNFTFANWSPGTRRTREEYIRIIAIHEFGHALGSKHEQARPDTPAWCVERDEGGGDGFKCDGFDGPFDLSSVMNYCNPNWNGSGNLSGGDIAMVRRYYGSPVPTKPTRGMNCVCPDGFSSEACETSEACVHVCRAHEGRTNHNHGPVISHEVDCPQPPPACPAGKKACGGACVDTNSDVAICGVCGQRCTGAERCNGGRCEDCLAACNGQCNVPSPTCGSSISCVCPAGSTCQGTKCCPSGSRGCNGACVNVSSDRNNCGSCGVRCRGQCRGGECECDRCRCPDGFCGGPGSCEGTEACTRICRAHERPGVHTHGPCN